MTDTEGNKAYEFAYGTYGELTAGSAGEILFLYNGRLGVITDENGLYYMRTRYYNPDIKRFINQDVVSGSITNSQSLNRYAYVQGNPVSYTDPFGLSPYDMFSCWGHTILDIIGFVPVVGDVADLVNAAWYLMEGNVEMAVASGISALPFVGSFIGNGLELVFKGTKYAEQAVRAGQYIIKAACAVSGGATCFRGFANEASCFEQAGNSELSISKRIQYGLLGILNMGIGTMGGYQCLTNTVSLGKMMWQDTGSYIKSAVSTAGNYIKSAVNSAKNYVKGAVNSAKTYVKNAVSSVKSYVGGSSYKSDSYSSLRDLMSPEEVTRYDGYWNKVGYDKAITARNMLIQNTVDANKKAVAIGAYDIETGNVTAKFAGAIPDTINNQLIERANLIGGIGSKGINGKNTVGVCAEFQAANELLNNGGNLTNIRFTEAVRPRTGKVIPTCSNCIEMFYESFK